MRHEKAWLPSPNNGQRKRGGRTAPRGSVTVKDSDPAVPETGKGDVRRSSNMKRKSLLRMKGAEEQKWIVTVWGGRISRVNLPKSLWQSHHSSSWEWGRQGCTEGKNVPTACWATKPSTLRVKRKGGPTQGRTGRSLLRKHPCEKSERLLGKRNRNRLVSSRGGRRLIPTWIWEWLPLSHIQKKNRWGKKMLEPDGRSFLKSGAQLGGAGRKKDFLGVNQRRGKRGRQFLKVKEITKEGVHGKEEKTARGKDRVWPKGIGKRGGAWSQRGGEKNDIKVLGKDDDGRPEPQNTAPLSCKLKSDI